MHTKLETVFACIQLHTVETVSVYILLMPFPVPCIRKKFQQCSYIFFISHHADSGWHWMTLDDIGWQWMTMDDNGWGDADLQLAIIIHLLNILPACFLQYLNLFIRIALAQLSNIFANNGSPFWDWITYANLIIESFAKIFNFYDELLSCLLTWHFLLPFLHFGLLDNTIILDGYFLGKQSSFKKKTPNS